MFTVAIVGRPNVGKSTLFNKLVGSKSAIVYDLPGVTRDRKEASVTYDESSFKLIDTAGFAEDTTELLVKNIIKQIDYALAEADLILFMLDAKAGLTSADLELANYLRKKNKDIILLINKAESKIKQITDNEIYKLGFKQQIFISAEHKIAFIDLLHEICIREQAYRKDHATELETEKGIRIAIVGKPNVGKSTFINKLIQSERLLTNDESGTTRDAIEIAWDFNGQKITLVDTAGMRKRARLKENIEKFSVEDSLKAIRFAEICIIIFDATQFKLEKQDINIASHVAKEGRGLVLVLNKIDLLTPQKIEEVLSEINYQVAKYLPQNRQLKIIKISAKQAKNLDNVIETALETHQNWNKKLDTALLNKWLKYVTHQHAAPLYKGKEVRFKYITQIKARPPTFVIMTNQPEQIPDSYIRYLKKSLVEDFELLGINPRFIFKKPNNPYSRKEGTKTIKK